VYFDRKLKTVKIIEHLLKTDKKKDVIKKANLILDNTRSLDYLANSYWMISNIIKNEREEFERNYPKLDKWILETITNELQKETEILFLLKKCQFLERKININRQ
jgi:hypothetical protein